jgi:hypothetical protein
MDTFILRFEAADFGSTVFDMPRLSAIRGASLAYLYSDKLVKQTLEKQTGVVVNEVYTGASQGAWRLTCSHEAAKKASDAVRDALRKDDAVTGPHSHLCYQVSLVKGDDGKALALAESLNATARYQGEGFPLPMFDPSLRGYDTDGDRARPADGKMSKARQARQDFGRRQRQNFYRDFGGRTPSHDFVDDFETMVKDAPFSRDDSPASKTAIFFADGNKLDNKRKAAVRKGLDHLTNFSNELKANQQRLLAQIVDWLERGATLREQHFCVTDGEDGKLKFRFETLMWGGDEMLFVMPSWLGLEFSENFFRWTQDWHAGGSAVTFSAGLVIANHKTPIRQTKQLAGDLAQINKDLSGQEVSALQAEVFESLSVPDTDLQTYRDRLYVPSGTTDDDTRSRINRGLMLRGANISDILDRVRRLKGEDGFPRSQLYSMIRKAAEEKIPYAPLDSSDSDKQLFEYFDLWKSRAGSESGMSRNDLHLLRFSGEGAASLKLSLAITAMLWDYVDDTELVA